MNIMDEIKEAYEDNDWPEHEFRGYCGHLLGTLEDKEERITVLQKENESLREELKTTKENWRSMANQLAFSNGARVYELRRHFGGTGMIEWKLFSQNIPPKVGHSFLITDGKNVTVAEYGKHPIENFFAWWNDDSGSIVEDVTHYAEINLPLK